MPKSLYSSRECPDSMADRLAAHRFGVFACTVLTVFGSLWISNAMSVREEERHQKRLLVRGGEMESPLNEGTNAALGDRMEVERGRRVRMSDLSSFDQALSPALPGSRVRESKIAQAQ